MYQILQKFDIHWHDGGPSMAMMYHFRRVSDLLCNWKSCLLCYMKDVVLHCSIFFKWNKLVWVRVRVWCRLQPWGCVCGCGHRIWCRFQPLGWSAVCVAVVTGYGADSSHGAVCVAVVTGYGADSSHWVEVLCVWLWSRDMVQTPAMGLCAVCVAVVTGYGADSSRGTVCCVCGYGHRIWFRLQPWGCVCGCGHRIWFRLQPWSCVLCVWLWSQDMV